MRKYLDRKEREIEVAKPQVTMHDVVQPDDDEADGKAEDFGIALKPPSRLTQGVTDVPPEDAGSPQDSPDSAPVESVQGSSGRTIPGEGRHTRTIP